MMDFYLDIADTIDFNYLIDKFKDGRSESEVYLELIEMVNEMMKLFGFAGHEFLNGLGSKMRFSDYVD